MPPLAAEIMERLEVIDQMLRGDGRSDIGLCARMKNMEERQDKRDENLKWVVRLLAGVILTQLPSIYRDFFAPHLH